MANPFLDGTRVDHTGEGRYRGAISEDWVLRPLPQGGVVTAIALRAMQAELDHPEQRLRTLHTSFVGQVAAGPVEVDVEVLRRGRSMSHARAEVALWDCGDDGTDEPRLVAYGTQVFLFTFPPLPE